MTDVISNIAALVNAGGLSKTYKQGGTTIEAVHGTTCTIRAGARIAIMGASGSGKSTLLHMLAGLESPTAGDIAWPALGPPEDLRPAKIAVAFQGPSLIPFLNVVENVALPLFLIGKDRYATDLAMIELARFDLAELADKLPDELSGGQAQRAAMARAMVTSPRLLLADEPTGQLDQATGRAAVATLISWADVTGSAIVVATHDRAIAGLLDEIWTMEHGRLTNQRRGEAA